MTKIKTLHWPLIVGLGVFALFRPVIRVIEDQAGLHTGPGVPIGLTLAISVVWILAIGLSRVAESLLTGIFTGLSYAVLAGVLSAILSPILQGQLQGPLTNPAALVMMLITNAVWGAIVGAVATAIRTMRRSRRQDNSLSNHNAA
jgi:hypothetical protein